ncbi:MAG: FecR family protein [Campylobacterota bacterium]|nr:FecR family protein [Campylobacterota bacterium]
MRIFFFFLTLTAFLWSNIGNVGAFKGTATISRSSSTLNVKNGMVLKLKDKIITADKSRVQVILKDNTVVTIGPNSIFIFDAYKFGGKDDSEVKMHIDRGFFRSVTGKIGKLAPERFKVKTASATIGIRGTDFSALISEGKETITCYKGGLNVSMGDTSHKVDAGMMLELSNGKAEIKAFSINRGLQTVYRKGNIDQIKADEISDAAQQEIQEKISDLPEVPLDEPNVEFPDR